MATWIIRSRTGTLRRRKKCYPCLPTQEGGCRIRRRHQQPHARTTIRSWNGEASCMGRVFTTLQCLLDGCLHALTSRFTRWTKPLTSSLPLATLTDLGKSKSELIAENAFLRQQLIMTGSIKILKPPIMRLEPMPSVSASPRSVRQDCLDHLLILHEKQLQHVLNKYVAYAQPGTTPSRDGATDS
jgi:hypothetical protein